MQSIKSFSFTKFLSLFKDKFVSPLRCYGHEISQNSVHVDIGNKGYTFPTVWLRDNCQCASCFHKDSKSRIINWIDFNVDIEPESINDCQNNNQNVVIKWKDGHLSTFSKDWLEGHDFSQDSQKNYLKNVYRLKRHPWTTDNFNTILQKFNYQDLLSRKESMKNWLETLRIYGIAIITDAPANEDSATIVANKVEFPKQTHYGKKFIVKAKPGTTNVAYLSTNLQMHTDLPYYEYKPGVNLLHCLKQADGSGGENLLSDGLYVAELMKVNHSEAYNILTKTPVDWVDIGQEADNKFHSIYRAPVICENQDGEIVRINHSVPQRGSHFNIPIEDVKPWYKAMKLFVDLIHSNGVTYKMNPNEILCFDNIRLLHGRKAYTDSEQSTRYIVGVYLDWDYIFSRIRVLSNFE